jgi:5'-nucleotidase
MTDRRTAMEILLTNDDGIESPGLQRLASRLRREHSLWIAAPDSNRSAVSHAVTVHSAVVFTRLEEQVYTCSGTPADCVLYALGGAVPCRPDVVVSGINNGWNIGEDIIYSGTIAAAREAAMFGIPSIAVSASESGWDEAIEAGSKWILENLQLLISCWKPDILLSINVPSGDIRGWEPARISRMDQGRSVKPVFREGDRTAYMLSGGGDRTGCGSADHETDCQKLERGIITVSPVKIFPSYDEELIEKLQLAAEVREKSYGNTAAD